MSISILDLIGDIDDPRMQGKVKHNLETILFTALCGVLSNCESWSDISDYCEAKQDWLSQYVEFPNGIPSAWTYRRLFTLLDPNIIEKLLREHASAIIQQNGKETDQIAIDGKALRGSKRRDLQCLHSVTAWCYENGVVLGEEQVRSKSNEIAAIPLLLSSLDLKGKTITIDAAGCQKAIAQTIQEKKGNYVFGLKRNHPTLHDAALLLFEKKTELGCHKLADFVENKHGRQTRRRYFSFDAKGLPSIEEWKGAKSIVAVETMTSKNNDLSGKLRSEWRFYLTSHKAKLEGLPGYIRNHWGIENKLHWSLDVSMREDDDQKAERLSVRSFSLLRRIALNIVKSKDLTPKRSVRRKLKRSGWDNDYLVGLLMLDETEINS